MNLNKLVIVVLSLIFCQPLANLLKPALNQELNYIHVPFEWNQQPDAVSYYFEIDTLIAFENPLTDSIIERNYLLLDSKIDWDKRYYWRVKSIFGDGNTGHWIGPSIFFTKQSVVEQINVEIFQEQLIQPGLTGFGGWSPEWRSAIVDKNGKEIWNDNGFAIKLSMIDSLGRLYGFSLTNWPAYTGVKINVDVDPIWHPENTHVDDHEIIELKNGNFMGFTFDDRLGFIPSDNYMTDAFRSLGYAADDSTLEFMWRGHVITEWNKEKEIVWTWNAWDHFSMEDYDNNGFTWWAAFNWGGQFYDWMHSNSIFFDETNDHVYMSTRHLSRITKISYPSGNVIWNMGLPSPYMETGDESICTDLLFSFQHHAQILDNGNLLFFDNGNLSDQLFNIENRISRVIELEVIGDSTCNVVWEYNFPPNLFGSAGGGVFVLPNNNKLIYTLGDGAGTNEPTILEIDEYDQLVWELKLPGHALHRPFRIPSLHPDGFSIVFDNYKNFSLNDDNTDGIIIDDVNTDLSFTVFNESDYDQPYVFILSDQNNWFGYINDTILIESKDQFEINIRPIVQIQNQTSLTMTSFPLFHDYNQKELSFEVYNLSNELKLNKGFQTKKFTLNDAYPNPFNNKTSIDFYLPKEGNVELIIYNSKGYLVTKINKLFLSQGHKSLSWDGKNSLGMQVSAGLYFYQLNFKNISQTKKFIYLK